jgi:hypothetical protein
MEQLALKITNEIKKLSPQYLKEVLDYIEFLKSKILSENDTEYLEKIEGFVESIEEGKKEDIKNCVTLKSIGWE